MGFSMLDFTVHGGEGRLPSDRALTAEGCQRTVHQPLPYSKLCQLQPRCRDAALLALGKQKRSHEDFSETIFQERQSTFTVGILRARPAAMSSRSIPMTNHARRVIISPNVLNRRRNLQLGEVRKLVHGLRINSKTASSKRER